MDQAIIFWLFSIGRQIATGYVDAFLGFREEELFVVQTEGYGNMIDGIMEEGSSLITDQQVHLLVFIILKINHFVHTITKRLVI